MLFNLVIILMLLNPLGNVYFPDKPFFDIAKNENAPIPERINLENIGVKVTAKRFAAIDVNSGKLLLQKDSQVKQPIASITKIMTALVILDHNPRWQEIVELVAKDETVGAQPHIYRGEQVRFIDLWKAALVSSDNNSIMAMVRSLGYSDVEFVSLMNKKAEELQMFNSSFADSTGLSSGNVSTALDLGRLVYAAMQKNEIKESVLQGSYELKIFNNKKNRKLINTDILIDSFLNKKKYGYELIGGKTGFTNEAGYCLAVKISKEGHPVIVVVLDSDTIGSRFQDVKAVADWVYTNYTWDK
jgi:D-alanyl-D-alanine endopeptidase (penicillin-binding protein 7)